MKAMGWETRQPTSRNENRRGKIKIQNKRVTIRDKANQSIVVRLRPLEWVGGKSDRYEEEVEEPSNQ